MASTELQTKTSNQELDPEITLGVLKVVEDNDTVTQRFLAKELGIALGLANAYLKRCVKKGLIKISHAPANRYLYYLTPQGFGEKSRLTAQYLTTSFNFFRSARKQCEQIFLICEKNNWHKVALYGKSELAEIAILSATETTVEIIGIIEPNSSLSSFIGYNIFSDIKVVGEVDAFVITNLSEPQVSFDELSKFITTERILAPRFMHISRNKKSFID